MVFEAKSRQLLLYSAIYGKILKFISLVDMEACNCIEFSMKSYYIFKECLSRVKENH